MNLLQAMLDHQSALVSFEALQQAPAASEPDTGSRGTSVVSLPAPAPQGLFRPGAGSGF